MLASYWCVEDANFAFTKIATTRMRKIQSLGLVTDAVSKMASMFVKYVINLVGLLG